MAKLESLVVDLQLKSAVLQKGLDAATKKLDDFGKKVDGIGKTVTFSAVTGAVKTLTSALVDFVRHGAQTADSMGKMAASAGVSVESFSRLQYAAQLGGVGAEEFSGAMSKLNKAISEAATGSSQQAALFKALGVSVKDANGNVRAADAVFLDVADAFDKMAPGASKARLEMELFGKSGAKMESVFAGGAKALREAGDEADRLGITISSKAAAGAQEFNDSFEKITLALERVGSSVAGEVAPAFSRLTDWLLHTKEGADLLKGAVTVLSTVMKVLATVAIGVGAAFDVIGTALAGAAAQFIEMFKGNFAGAREIGEQMTKDIKKTIATAGKLIGTTWEEAGEKADESAKKFKKSGDTAAKGFVDGKKAADESKQAIQALEKIIIGMEQKIAEAGSDGPFAELEARLESGDIADLLKKMGAGADETKEKIRALGMALHEVLRAKANAEIDFQANLSNAGTDYQASRMKQDHVAPGTSARVTAAAKTKGTADFDDAIDKWAIATRRAANKQAEAEKMKGEADVEGYRNAVVAAEAARLSADLAMEAAEGWQELEQIDFEASQATLQGIINGLSAIGSQFSSKLGDLGKVIDAAVSGAQSGGVWGAIIAVIIELLSRFERFSEIMDIANGVVAYALEGLASGLGSLIDGLKPLFGALNVLDTSAFEILTPILELIGKLFENIAPLLVVVGDALGMVATTLQPLFQIIGAVIDSLMILNPVLGLISLAMLGLKIVFAGVNLGLNMFVDDLLKIFGGNNRSGVEKAEKDVADAIKEAEKAAADFAKDPFGALGDRADDAAENLEEMGKQTEESTKKTTDALDRLTRQFTNLPNGFKVAGRIFNATDPVGGGSGGGGGGSYNPFENDGRVTTIVVQGSLVTEREVSKYVTDGQAKRNWQRLGSWR